MAKRDVKAVIYTDDAGNDYVIGLDAAVFAQTGASTAVKVGGSDYTGSPALAPMPRNLRPRTVTVSEATHGKRRVVCLETTSELFTGTETQINLQVLGAAPVTFTRYRSTGESYRSVRDPAG